jgi:hypothetical protein
MTLSACVRYFAEDREAGLGLLEVVVRDHPDFLLAVWLLSWGATHTSKPELAVEMAERAAELSNRAGHFMGSLGLMCGLSGMQAKARAALDEMRSRGKSQHVSPLWLAWIHLGLGEKERALDLLDQAITQRSPYLYTLHQDPNYSSLWSDPRFQGLARKVGSDVASRPWERSVEGDHGG